MNNIRKKIIVLCLAASIAGSYTAAFAADSPSVASGAVNQTEETAVPAPRSMTITDAIEYAKEHSYSIAALKATEATALAQKDLARQTLRNYQKSGMAVASDINSALLFSGHTYRAACLSYRQAARNTILGGYELESNVSQAFYSYLSLQKQLELAKDSLKTAQERLVHAETKYSNGLISENDLDSFKLSVTEAKSNVSSTERNLSLSMRTFKTTINYPQEGELIITGSFERQPIDTTTPEEAVKKAENSLLRVTLDEALELSKFKYERSIGFYTASSVGGKSAKAEYAKEQLTYKNSVDQMENGIYTAYNTMQTAYEALDYLDQNIALAERLVAASKTQYDLGLITATDYLANVQQLNSVKNSIADTELNAYIAKEAYKNLYYYTNTVEQEDDPLL